jgi:hypothetical protein
MMKSSQAAKGKYSVIIDGHTESKKRKKDRLRQMNVDPESEGEAGDTGHFANWAGTTQDNDKPLPKFEKSVFNMQYQDQKRMIEAGKSNSSNWPAKDGTDPDNGKKRRDRTKKRNDSKDKEPELLPHQVNAHQMRDTPEQFTKSHPGTADSLRFAHPERITTTFDEGKEVQITFSSDFCSGNMSRVARGNQRGEYLLWISNDTAPYNDQGYRTWFYFSVKGVPQGEQLTFTFRNLNEQK